MDSKSAFDGHVNNCWWLIMSICLVSIGVLQRILISLCQFITSSCTPWRQNVYPFQTNMKIMWYSTKTVTAVVNIPFITTLGITTLVSMSTASSVTIKIRPCRCERIRSGPGGSQPHYRLASARKNVGKFWARWWRFNADSAVQLNDLTYCIFWAHWTMNRE